MKNDLISRQAAIDALFELYEYQRDIDPTEAADLVRQGVYLAKKKIEQLPSAQPERKWIPCSEKPPKEDHWLGGSGKQFSEKVLVTIVNHSDEDTWVDMTHTVDGEWMLELPRHCEITAWMPMPEPYQGENDD